MSHALDTWAAVVSALRRATGLDDALLNRIVGFIFEPRFDEPRERCIPRRSGLMLLLHVLRERPTNALWSGVIACDFWNTMTRTEYVKNWDIECRGAQRARLSLFKRPDSPFPFDHFSMTASGDRASEVCGRAGDNKRCMALMLRARRQMRLLPPCSLAIAWALIRFELRCPHVPSQCIVFGKFTKQSKVKKSGKSYVLASGAKRSPSTWRVGSAASRSSSSSAAASHAPASRLPRPPPPSSRL